MALYLRVLHLHLLPPRAHIVPSPVHFTHKRVSQQQGRQIYLKYAEDSVIVS